MTKEEVKKLISVHNNLTDTKNSMVRLSNTKLLNTKLNSEEYKTVASKISVNIDILREMIMESGFLVNSNFEKLKLYYD